MHHWPACVHEAGHAVVATALGRRLHYIQIGGVDPDGCIVPYASIEPLAYDYPIVSTAEAEHVRRGLLVHVAGYLAERIANLADDPGPLSAQYRAGNLDATRDLQLALIKVEALTAWRSHQTQFNRNRRSPYASERRALAELLNAEQRATALLESRWESVLLLAAALQRCKLGRMSGEEVGELLGGCFA